MARPRKKPLEMTEYPEINPEVTEASAEPKSRRGGRRKRTPPAEPVNETRVLIDVVLRSRGAKGATPEILHSVVSWARAIREEGETLSGLAEHPRRQRAETSMERVARFEMNRALLDGVLNGTISLTVQENGELLFLYSNAVPEPTYSAPSINGDTPSPLTEG